MSERSDGSFLIDDGGEFVSAVAFEGDGPGSVSGIFPDLNEGFAGRRMGRIVFIFDAGDVAGVDEIAVGKFDECFHAGRNRGGMCGQGRYVAVQLCNAQRK